MFCPDSNARSIPRPRSASIRENRERKGMGRKGRQDSRRHVVGAPREMGRMIRGKSEASQVLTDDRKERNMMAIEMYEPVQDERNRAEPYSLTWWTRAESSKEDST